MALNFPTAAQAAAQTPVNTYGPNSLPIANTDNDVTYTWDGTKWSANTAPGVYLRLDATNDPVTGNCEFSAGVEVSTTSTFHGQVFSDSRVQNGRQFFCKPGPGSFTGSATTSGSGQYVANADTLTTSTANAKYSGFLVDQAFGGNVTLPASGELAGFRSHVAANHADNAFNFYAAGDARNFFAGSVKIAPSSDNDIGLNGFGLGINITSSSGNVAINRSGGTGQANPALYLRRTNPSSSGGWRVIEMYNHNNSSSGFLKISGATARTIDSRLGATGVAMPDGAAEIVKALQPKVITQSGETFNGFLPADLAGTFAAAVDGEAGATVAIGTYTDPDGNVETDIEEPEAVPYGATWQQTGIKDVMQGVSRGELIPLLTKALQEALARIEALEAAKTTTRKRKS